MRETGESSRMKKRRLTAKDDVLNEAHSSVGSNDGAEWNLPDQNRCDIRNRVKETLQLYQKTYKKFQRENKAKPRTERGCSYTKASEYLKAKGKLLDTSKWFGNVPGVEIGDEFQSKADLRIIGLHYRRFCGIDYLERKGDLLATSVVVTNRYANKMESSDVLVYVGEGGNPLVKYGQEVKDQKLVRGNLALKNNIKHKIPVRVIVCREQKGAKCLYVYEGLYLVESYWPETGKSGKLVFKFRMRKFPREQNMSKHVTSESKKNFSHIGKSPIRKELAKDKGKAPLLGSKSRTRSGCDCVKDCSELEDCSCKVKNGGKMPYDRDGCVVRKMSFINECGLSCKCPSSCMNRVTQRGTRAELELFENRVSSYGVRSKSYISKGSFICEFKPRQVFLGEKKPNEMDVSGDRNVGRFIDYSSAPNLYCEKVIIGHEDEPHMMLFAMRNISPSEELTIGLKNKVLNSLK